MTAEQLAIPPGDTLLNSEEAAQYLNVPRSTLRNKRRDWGLNPYRIGRALQYPKSELDEYKARNREINREDALEHTG